MLSFEPISLSLDNLQEKATVRGERGCDATCGARLTVWRAVAFCRCSCAVEPGAVEQPTVTFCNLYHTDLLTYPYTYMFVC